MFKENEAILRTLFSHSRSPEQIYEKLLDLGKKQQSLTPAEKTEESRVKGCQSQMFLRTTLKEGLFYFETQADALISAGLGQTLVLLYSGLDAKEILLNKPTILDELGLVQNLSPSRSNGLAALDLKIRQDVVRKIQELSS